MIGIQGKLWMLGHSMTEQFTILTVYDGSEKCVFEGTVVGYKKIVLLDKIKTKELVIEIIDSRVAPTLSYIGIFE